MARHFRIVIDVVYDETSILEGEDPAVSLENELSVRAGDGILTPVSEWIVDEWSIKVEEVK